MNTQTMTQGTDTISSKLIRYLRDQLDSTGIGYETPLQQLQGGFETASYSFTMNGVQPDLAVPLVLRLYPEYYGSGNATWESAVQNTLAAEGYPVAKAHLLCTDLSVLGGAFFIMDYLPGVPMISEPMERVPVLLGKTQAALHRINPKPLVRSLVEAGFDESRLFLKGRTGWLVAKAREYPWVREAAEWLGENRPPETERLAVCHGDFHPLNILVKDGAVSGVLDWPGFIIADPALDVATTMVLSTIPFKYVGPQIGIDLTLFDFDNFGNQYLEAYRSEMPLDESHLAYFRTRRCVHALIQGVDGQDVWRYPPVVQDLIGYIQSVSGIQVKMPG